MPKVAQAKATATAAQKPDKASLPIHEIVDDVVRVLQSTGFRQVALPQLFSESSLRGNEILADYFHRQSVSIPNPSDDELYLAPTQLFNIYDLYQNQDSENTFPVARWFYVSRVVKNGEKGLESEHELGMFVLGDSSSLAFVQLIRGAKRLCDELGSTGTMVELNSVGCDKCQDDYREILQNHLMNEPVSLCKDCKQRVEDDALRVLDCDSQGCQEAAAAAPQFIDFLDEGCQDCLVGVLETLDELEIPYNLTPSLRPKLLEQQVLFQISQDSEKVPVIFGHGGDLTRYFAHLNDEPIPVVGFISSLEKLAKITSVERKRNVNFSVDVFTISLGDVATRRVLSLSQELHDEGVRVRESVLGHSGIKDQLQAAKRHHPEIALIIGQKEALDDTVILRDMRSSMQETFPRDRIIEEVKKRLGK